jgi:hypothetical protein
MVRVRRVGQLITSHSVGRFNVLISQHEKLYQYYVESTYLLPYFESVEVHARWDVFLFVAAFWE